MFHAECDSEAILGCKWLATWAGPGPDGSMKLRGEAPFFRMIVSVAETVKNCTAHIEEIRRGDETLWTQPLQIPFCDCREDEEGYTKTISCAEPARLEILYCTPQDTILLQAKNAPDSLDAEKLFALPGDYLLKVVVRGDGADPLTARLKFQWPGRREEARLVLIG